MFGQDEWDKADELTAIGRRLYDRSELEVISLHMSVYSSI